MKRSVHKAVVLTVGAIIMLIAGCEEQSVSKSEVKRDRLVASENRQLKKQMEKLGKELKGQKELLAKRLQEKEDSEEKLKKSIDEQMKKLKTTTDENIILQQTNDGLNTRIKELEEELETFKDSKKFKKWQEETQKSIDDMAENAVRDFEEVVRLREENEKLQGEITELKKELETHKASVPSTD